MSEARLFALQRLSAMLLGPLVILHLAVILYAIQGGLTAEEILGRTRSSFLWPAFYGLFVLAVAVHAPLGLRAMAREWLGLGRRAADILALVFFILFLGLGLRAVAAIA